MNEMFLLKLGEIVLKGGNRFQFENRLKTNIARRMRPFGDFRVSIVQSTAYVEPENADCDLDGAWEACHAIFGVVSLICAYVNYTKVALNGDHFFPQDVLMLSNAGVVRSGPVTEMEKKDFDFVTSINYTGYFLCSKYAAIIMQAQHEGSPSPSPLSFAPTISR